MKKKSDQLEDVKIRLALLKENFEYQKSYYHYLEVKKDPVKVTTDPSSGTKVIKIQLPSLEPPPKSFGLKNVSLMLFFPYQTPVDKIQDKILDILNPQKDLSDVPEEIIKEVLPYLFHEHAIHLLNPILDDAHYIKFLPQGDCDESLPGCFLPTNLDGKGSAPFGCITAFLDILGGKTYEGDAKSSYKLKPWERIYKVDLTKKKAHIMKEFKQYIDAALSKNTGEDWIQNKKRLRDEQWTHLKVWRLRKQKKSFSEIGKTLGISVDAAKKSYYRAFELTQGKKLNPDFRKEMFLVKITDIQKPCLICSDRKTCKDLCPDALRYVTQDEVSLREKHLSKDSDSHRDYFLYKSDNSDDQDQD